MKIILDNELVLELSDIQKKVLCYDLLEEDLTKEAKRRLAWVIMDKYENCFKRLKLEWDPKLAERGIEMIPTNKDKYASLVFTQEDYKARNQQ